MQRTLVHRARGTKRIAGGGLAMGNGRCDGPTQRGGCPHELASGERAPAHRFAGDAEPLAGALGVRGDGVCDRGARRRARRADAAGGPRGRGAAGLGGRARGGREAGGLVRCELCDRGPLCADARGLRRRLERGLRRVEGVPRRGSLPAGGRCLRGGDGRELRAPVHGVGALLGPRRALCPGLERRLQTLRAVFLGRALRPRRRRVCGDGRRGVRSFGGLPRVGRLHPGRGRLHRRLERLSPSRSLPRTRSLRACTAEPRCLSVLRRPLRRSLRR